MKRAAGCALALTIFAASALATDTAGSKGPPAFVKPPYGVPDFHKPPHGAPGHTRGVTCTAASINLAFGAYDPVRRVHADTVGNIAVACTGQPGARVAYTISLGAGSGGAYTPRRMKTASGAALAYNIYSGADRRIVWGDGNAGTSVVSDGLVLSSTRVVRNYPVYGRAFRGQNVPVGSYSDLIVVTLDF